MLFRFIFVYSNVSIKKFFSSTQIERKMSRLTSFVSFQATLITLGVQVYEILRPKFPHIVEIMQQIPNTNVADIQKLDEKVLMGAQSKGKIDKYKKDLFKKITAQVNIVESNFFNAISISNEKIQLFFLLFFS